MDKSRSKHPPDVNEALSSMLWTPYDHNNSTSSDSLSDFDDELQQRLKRYSNPLPNSCNWWTGSDKVQNPHNNRYSFPYYGNYLSTTTGTHHSVKTVSSMVNSSNINHLNMVHSYTEDFLHYQRQPYPSPEYQVIPAYNNKSQPSLMQAQTHKFNHSNHSIHHDVHNKFTTASAVNRRNLENEENPIENFNKNRLKTIQFTNEMKIMLPDDSFKNENTDEIQPHSTNNPSSQSINEMYASRGQLSCSVMEERGNVDEYNCSKHKQQQQQQQHKHTSITTIEQHEKFLRNEISHNLVLTECVSQQHQQQHKTNINNRNKNNNNLMSVLNIENDEHISNSNSCDKSLINYSMYPNNGEVSNPKSQIHFNEILNKKSNECINNRSSENDSEELFSNINNNNIFISYSDDRPSSAQASRLVEYQFQFGKFKLNEEIDNRNEVEHNINEVVQKGGQNSCSNNYSNLNANRVHIEPNISYEIINENNQNIVNVPPKNNIGNLKNLTNNIHLNNNQSEMDNIDVIITDGLSTDNETLNHSNGTIESTTAYQPPSTSTSVSTSASSTTNNKAKYSNEYPTTTNAKEKRRKDRRDRRQARTRSGQVQNQNSTLINRNAVEILPDIINNHLPPPYSAVSVTLPTVPSVVSTVPVVEDSRYSFTLPTVRRRSPSERSGKDCCGQWFSWPPLRFLVALVALGGVACTLGGATLGATSLAGSPTSHLTAGLLMTGVGIILVTVSGVAWRMSSNDAHQCTDFGRCGRRQCGRGNTSFGLLYPEFQHRPPPPSYSASMQQYRLRMLLMDRDRQIRQERASPPPTYHSNIGTTLWRSTIIVNDSVEIQQQQHHAAASISADDDRDNRPSSSQVVTATISQSQSQPQTVTTKASIDSNSFSAIENENEMGDGDESDCSINHAVDGQAVDGVDDNRHVTILSAKSEAIQSTDGNCGDAMENGDGFCNDINEFSKCTNKELSSSCSSSLPIYPTEPRPNSTSHPNNNNGNNNNCKVKYVNNQDNIIITDNKKLMLDSHLRVFCGFSRRSRGQKIIRTTRLTKKWNWD